jgi:hypothetical protein
LEQINGTGKDGRVTNDILEYVKNRVSQVAVWQKL